MRSTPRHIYSTASLLYTHSNNSPLKFNGEWFLSYLDPSPLPHVFLSHPLHIEVAHDFLPFTPHITPCNGCRLNIHLHYTNMREEGRVRGSKHVASRHVSAYRVIRDLLSATPRAQSLDKKTTDQHLKPQLSHSKCSEFLHGQLHRIPRCSKLILVDKTSFEAVLHSHSSYKCTQRCTHYLT